jgi:hypothetical protein
VSARPEAAALWAEAGAGVPRQEAVAQDAPVPLAAAVVSQDAAARPREAAAARHGAAVEEAQLGAAVEEEAQPGAVVVAAEEPRDGVAAARVARRVGPGAPAVAQPSAAAWASLLLPWPGPLPAAQSARAMARRSIASRSG